MTALPKASRMAEDHPQRQKMLKRSRFLRISGAMEKNQIPTARLKRDNKENTFQRRDVMQHI